MWLPWMRLRGSSNKTDQRKNGAHGTHTHTRTHSNEILRFRTFIHNGRTTVRFFLRTHVSFFTHCMYIMCSLASRLLDSATPNISRAHFDIGSKPTANQEKNQKLLTLQSVAEYKFLLLALCCMSAFFPRNLLFVHISLHSINITDILYGVFFMDF